MTEEYNLVELTSGWAKFQPWSMYSADRSLFLKADVWREQGRPVKILVSVEDIPSYRAIQDEKNRKK
jgi:hypothetical protein